MDKSCLNMDKATNFERLAVEKRKIETHCLNLECKNEQLKILIEKLNRISNQRESLFLRVQGVKKNSRDINVYNNGSSLLKELKIAKENSLNIEENINILREEIGKINSIILK